MLDKKYVKYVNRLHKKETMKNKYPPCQWRNQMTTPREHAELAARLERLETTIQAVCQYNGGYNSLEVQEAFYDVVHELQDLGIDTKPPPIKRTITLTVNGREWVLPEPLKGPFHLGRTYYVVGADGRPSLRAWMNADIDNFCQANLRMSDTKDDCQAWADFNKWCRGGGV